MFLPFLRHFVREQRQVPPVEPCSPLCSGAEGVQSRHHRWRDHAACELRQNKRLLIRINSVNTEICHTQVSDFKQELLFSAGVEEERIVEFSCGELSFLILHQFKEIFSIMLSVLGSASQYFCV